MNQHVVPLRRTDKKIDDDRQVQEIIQKAVVCRLAMCDGDQPYVVPLCFGHRDGVLYFHSATRGRKIDILKRNPNVCIEFDIDLSLQTSDKACNWGMWFKSVIGFGRVEFIDAPADRRAALDIIMAHYSTDSWDYPDSTVAKIAVFKVRLDHLTGKQGPAPPRQTGS